MNENVLNNFISGLTGGWYLDVEFLVNIIDKHNLDIEEILESIEMNFGKEYKCDFNYIVHETLSTLSYQFIEENEVLFKSSEDEEFEIFTNYMDSHIRFNNEDIQKKFEEYY